MPDCKFAEGGRFVELVCKVSRCMKKVKNHWFKRTQSVKLYNVSPLYMQQNLTNDTEV